MGTNVAKICVSTAKYEFDRPYDYYLPPELRETVRPGMRVMVPFGRGNGKVEGMVLALGTREDLKGVKPVFAALDSDPILPEDLLRLALWIRETCFCTCYDAIRAILPQFLGMTHACRYTPRDSTLCESEDEEAVYGFLAARGSATGGQILSALAIPEGERLLRRMAARGVLSEEDASQNKVREKTARFIRVEDPAAAEELIAGESARTRPQADALRELLTSGPMAAAELCYRTGVSPSTLKTLAGKGIAAFYDAKILRVPTELQEEGEKAPAPVLSEEQQQVLEGLAALAFSGKPSCALLEGVTGSGKTVVYLKLMEQVLARGRSCIVLVPEIALTPQMIRRFTGAFGKRVAVLHSALSDGERYDQWESIRRGEADVVVGTRSAVFAPVRDLGLIVMDEEQEYSYKSGETPRYHAREAAKWRVNAAGAMLLLGSATPSVESAWCARSGRYAHFRLCSRFADATLPEVVISDYKKDLRAGRDGPVGRELMNAIARTAGAGRQAILFLNRRGRNKRVFCAECGETIVCPRCSVTAAYHSANGRLMCHTCGWSEPMPTLCPSCGSRHLETDKAGTQRVEEQIREELPEVEVLRMDADTTAAAGSHDALLTRFREEKIPVLIGTQMVAKGLDFENVTLSAVLDADMGLQSEDFRAPERAFSLMTQVAGRSGRGQKPGIALLQTLTPENETVLQAARQDFDAFYESEIANREALGLPPFCDLLVFSSVSEDERAALRGLQGAKELLRQRLSGVRPAPQLIGPAPAAVAKVNNRYRFRLTVRVRADHAVRERAAGVLRDLKSRKEFANVMFFADINPYE